METEHSPEYRTVAVFGTVADAETIRGVLEADGIVVAVLDAADAALLPGAGRAVRLLVPLRDLARARELLASPVPAEDEPSDDGDARRGAVRSAPPRPSWSLRWTALLLLVGALVAIALAL